MNKSERHVGLLYTDIARFRGVIYDQMVEKHDLTHAQAHVLNNLYREDGLTQKAIAERMSIGTVTVSGLVDRLESKDLVRRETDKNDRRAKKVWLTKAALDVQGDLFDCLTKLNDICFEGFSDEEVDIMIGFLKRSKQNLLTFLNNK